MTVTTVADPAAAAERCAESLAMVLRAALAARGEAHIALNGGSTPRPVYQRLTELIDDWSEVHLWWCDERCVPPDDADSNFPVARETLIEGAAIGEDRVHRIRGELGPEEGAHVYAAELAEHLEFDHAGIPVLDVVHLGLGPDGHTASLFPRHDALKIGTHPPRATVAVFDAPKPPPERISLTMPCLNAARQRIVHTVGEAKRDAVRLALADPSLATPASLLKRSGLEVIVDDAAAP